MLSHGRDKSGGTGAINLAPTVGVASRSHVAVSDPHLLGNFCYKMNQRLHIMQCAC